MALFSSRLRFRENTSCGIPTPAFRGIIALSTVKYLHQPDWYREALSL